jgi:phosphoenolpyruvate carboxylase
VAYLEQRYASEPYRLVLSLLAADLEAASQEDMTSRLLDEAPHRARVTVDETREVVAMVAQAIPPVLADDALHALRIQLESFGLHAARLDIREDSGRLAIALAEILAGLGVDEAFAGKDEATRRRVLLGLLADDSPAPSKVAEAAGGETGGETWRLFRLLGRAQGIYGGESLGPFIVSMTRGPASLRSRPPTARWAVRTGLSMPLFETLDDPRRPCPRSSRCPSTGASRCM